MSETHQIEILVAHGRNSSEPQGSDCRNTKYIPSFHSRLSRFVSEHYILFQGARALNYLMPERVGEKHKANKAYPIGGGYVVDVDLHLFWRPHHHYTGLDGICVRCLTICARATLIMSELVIFDPVVHREEFHQMNIELLTWFVDQYKERYQIDIEAVTGSVQEYIEDYLEHFMNLKPPNGVLYIIEEQGKVAGMGALQKLRDTVGEVKRMYIRPQYRGRGYGKQMVNRLLDDGRRLGCSSFLLDTHNFMPAAQHIYRSVGFKERDAYPESEPPEICRPYMIFMEKIE